MKCSPLQPQDSTGIPVPCFSEGDDGHIATYPEWVLICQSKFQIPSPKPRFVPVTGYLILLLQPAQLDSQITVKWESVDNAHLVLDFPF